VSLDLETLLGGALLPRRPESAPVARSADPAPSTEDPSAGLPPDDLPVKPLASLGERTVEALEALLQWSGTPRLGLPALDLQALEEQVDALFGQLAALGENWRDWRWPAGLGSCLLIAVAVTAEVAHWRKRRAGDSPDFSAPFPEPFALPAEDP
jgi:hypothetical protein